MGLRGVFIVNLKKFRKREGLSQMKLAEKCNTAASYIGEIEIGRKFPSVELIEKFALALDIKPHRLFEDTSEGEAKTEITRQVLAELPPGIREEIINAIAEAVAMAVKKTLDPKNNS